MLSRLLTAFSMLLAGSLPLTAQTEEKASAIFAGGCFWCMEPPYDETDGVSATISGYSGGSEEEATYKQVSSGATQHFEVIKIDYDPARVSYEQLLNIFWRNIDPFDADGQFCDKGDHYKSAIFYGNENEKVLAEASKKAIEEKLGREVATDILPESKFYAAEDYHQDYYMKNPIRYKFYRYSCGRDARLEEVWGKKSS
ncbi:MAG: peptide-methionine (S)-S-oxide reductase MsrA [Hyphomicrobiales bacterium]|nr:peptide-methionine (S)-S-oxide reductase MsrA [Hyphomicrobiales bacterium]